MNPDVDPWREPTWECRSRRDELGWETSHIWVLRNPEGAEERAITGGYTYVLPHEDHFHITNDLSMDAALRSHT